MIIPEVLPRPGGATIKVDSGLVALINLYLPFSIKVPKINPVS